MKELTLDYLHLHPNLKLYQSKEMFRINTDTCLLGEFFKVQEGETLLDVGTNNGALLLYASQFTKSPLIGIDINGDALEIAKNNMELNHIQSFQLIHGDFIDYDFPCLFDVIVCNPPYFNTLDEQSKNLNIYLRNARHEEYLSLHNLLIKVEKTLKDEGNFYMVYRPSRLEEIKKEIANSSLKIIEIQFVNDLRKNKIVSILLHMKKTKEDIKTKESKIDINGF